MQNLKPHLGAKDQIILGIAEHPKRKCVSFACVILIKKLNRIACSTFE